MTWIVYKIDEYPGKLWADWDLMNSQHHNSNPLLNSDFIAPLHQITNEALLVGVATSDQNEITAMLLLKKNHVGIWQVFKPSQAPIALVVVNNSIDFDAAGLVSKLPGFAFKLDFYCLDPVEHGSVIAAAKGAQLSNHSVNIRITTNGTFDDYWNQRPKKLRSNIKRYTNRCTEECGECSFQIIETPEDILSATDRYGILESQGWKGKAKTALHPSNYQGQFYRRYLHAQACSGNALVMEMYIKDKLVASRLCVQKNGLLITLKTTFEESFKRYALGRLLLKRLIEWCFEQPKINQIDFYTNASPEQLEWSTEQRNMLNASVYIFSGLASAVSLLARIKQKKLTSPSTDMGD